MATRRSTSTRGGASRNLTPKFTTNPKTGREIEVGGKTYLEIAKDPKYADKLAPKPTAAQRRGSSGHSYSDSTRGGCSNQGKYRNEKIPANEFCGPAGKSCPSTFPSNTPARARAALSYARHAPDPQGIRDCVIRIAKKRGWYDETTGTIKLKEETKNPRRVSKKKPVNQLSKRTSGGTRTRTHNFCGCSA